MPDILCFFSRSKDAAPGKGAGESVDDPALYTELGAIKDWRKVLSNFHMWPFVFEGATYNTIEHAFQAAKIRLVDPEKAVWFTRESGHEIGQGDGLVARKHRKLVLLNSTQIAEWDQLSTNVMGRAALEKFRACEEARCILKATRDAQLWHHMARARPARFLHLEYIRRDL
jgi:ribA/ribD-fused uncharacterized protein